jgi:hypothetical protein
MNYFQPFLLPTEASIAAAWDTALVEFDAAPRLTAALTARRAVWLPRFADCYLQLISSPRGARRRLVRRLSRSRHLEGFWPFERRPIARGTLACSIAGAGLLITLLHSAEAATITVTTNSPGISDLDGRCSLVEAIVNANDDAAMHPDCAAGSGADIIVLPKGAQALTLSYSDYAGATALPVITSDITISGNPTKITRAKNAPGFRLFAVAVGGTLTLNDVALSGGTATSGGAVLNYGSLTIHQSTISGNAATKNGGGIYSRKPFARLFIHNSVVSGNQAASGGGIFSYEYVSIVDSVLSGNVASSEGGAIANYDGYLRIDNSTVAKNRATRAAGGIDNVYSTAKIFNSRITGNTAKYAGGIESYADASTVSKLYVYNSTISKNGAGVYAGGVANINGYFKLADTMVTGNKAGTEGGGVFNNGTVTFVDDHSTISKNKAPTGADVFP